MTKQQSTNHLFDEVHSIVLFCCMIILVFAALFVLDRLGVFSVSPQEQTGDQTDDIVGNAFRIKPAKEQSAFQKKATACLQRHKNADDDAKDCICGSAGRMETSDSPGGTETNDVPTVVRQPAGIREPTDARQGSDPRTSREGRTPARTNEKGPNTKEEIVVTSQSVCVDTDKSGTNEGKAYGVGGETFILDENGVKKPETVKKDVCKSTADEDGLLTEYYCKDNVVTPLIVKCTQSGVGKACNVAKTACDKPDTGDCNEHVDCKTGKYCIYGKCITQDDLGCKDDDFKQTPWEDIYAVNPVVTYDGNVLTKEQLLNFEYYKALIQMYGYPFTDFCLSASKNKVAEWYCKKDGNKMTSALSGAKLIPETRQCSQANGKYRECNFAKPAKCV